MKLNQFIVTASVFFGLLLSCDPGGASTNLSSTHPGMLCEAASLPDRAPPTVVYVMGRALNDSTGETHGQIHCPIIRTVDTDVLGVRVAILDQSDTGDVVCSVVRVNSQVPGGRSSTSNPNGFPLGPAFTTAGPVSSSGSTNQNHTLDIRVGASDFDLNDYLFVSCIVPAKSDGARSGVISYHVDLLREP